VTSVNTSSPAVPVAQFARRAPAWARLAPVGIGVLAAVVAFWNLALSGYANTYYSAAAQAASQSWAAMFYGAIDAAGFISVDKPPASLWAMGLSVRVLGLSPFAVLLPQALAGVGAALILWATVRRSFGPAAAVIAGVAFALTPVAAVMFRYNNPDALLTLLLVAAAWALVRGLDDDRFRWPMLVPHQVPAGVPRAAGVRADVSRGGPGRAPAASDRPRAGGRDGLRVVILVGRGGGAGTGQRPPVHRRQHEELGPGPDPGV
jgi:hypothetical protein